MVTAHEYINMVYKLIALRDGDDKKYRAFSDVVKDSIRDVDVILYAASTSRFLDEGDDV